MSPVPHAAPCFPALRTRTIGVLSVAALLVVSMAGPASAAAPSKQAALSGGGHRDQTSHHLASAAKAAGKLRVASGRSSAHPLRSVKVTSKASAGGLTRQATTASSSGATSTAAAVGVAATPDVKILQQFAGLTQSDAGNADPPDPWVAVNSSFVVQSVASKIRISNRAGVEQTSLASAALLGLAVDQAPSNFRIIWDATHGRWVASALSSNADQSANYLHLAVSDGSDPTAGWRVISTAFGAQVPDYPALASSNDKIVVSDNLFDASSSPVGADLNTWTWSSILGGAGLTYNHCTTDATRFNARPAQVLSSSTDVHVIMEEVPSGEQWYYRLTGAGACADVVDATHLSLLKPFAVPPQPRQLTNDTIANAVDERPTDAIWQNGHLWWVSTYPWSYDGGATFNAVVVLWSATTAASGAPINPSGQAMANGNGFDSFMGGVGMSRNGTLFTLYSQSSSTNFPYLLADQAQPGQFAVNAVQVDYGDAAAASERWGSFAGIAMDPVGTGTAWATHQVPAANGTWRTDVVRLVYDTDAPSRPGTPTTTLPTSTTVGSTVSARISWAASTDATSGVDHYDVFESVNGGAFASLGSQTATFVTRSQAVNHPYRYLVRAVDTTGNVSADSTGAAIKPTATQQAPASGYTAGWHTTSSTVYLGGSVRYSSTKNASVTYATSGARSLGVVATMAPSRGSFRVYVDNVYKGTISTYSTTTKYRQLVYQFSWSSPGTHRIKLIVSGTAGHARVDVDAFMVLR